MALDESVVLGAYELQREVGRGAMAVVHQAHDRRHGREVAVKVLRPEVALAVGADRFLQEIRIAARLHHPNILPLFDSGESEGRLYYVMPLVEAGTLRDRLRREGPLPVDEVVSIALGVAGALAAAHEQGVIHRDVKPENILLDNGRPLVADFGIARLLGGSAAVSTSGLSVGTPGYMSPEQVAGGKQLDGRSDLYSLGCVLYEMLAGEPPFTGPTVQAVASRHLHERVPSVAVVRSETPVWLATVVERCLAKLPVDRFRSAADLGRALANPPRPGAAGIPRRVVLGALIGVAVIAGLVLAAKAFTGRRAVALDPLRIVSVPFRLSGPGDSAAIDGTAGATLVYEALRPWTDLNRVDPLTVADMVARQGGSVPDLATALAVARSAGAGRLIWGDIEYRGGVGSIGAFLYDVARPGTALRDARITIDRGDWASAQARFGALVDTLLGGGQPPPGDRPSRPYQAVQAYTRGIDLTGAWDLEGGRDAFRQAVRLEPAYSAAALRWSKVSQWLRDDASEWRTAAVIAEAALDLTPRERSHATALRLMADEQYPEACNRYRSLAASDSTDFAAWFGLGECLAQDRLVEPDSSSHTGWRFRSSYEAAARAYRRAMAILPSAHLAPGDLITHRLTQVVFVTVGQYRPGASAGPDSAIFAAFPALSGDTLAFYPEPSGRLFDPRTASLPATMNEALDRGRIQLDEVSRTWTTVFPSSAMAWRARAIALEGAGSLTEPRGASAHSAVHRARTLTRDPAGAAGLGALEVRILVKGDSLTGALVLSDSLLADARVSPGAALVLAPLGGLVGKLGAMTRLLDQGAAVEVFTGAFGEQLNLPPALAEPGLRLLAYAVMGGSSDSVIALEDRIQRLISVWPDAGRRDTIALALLGPPATFGFPFFGRRPIHARARGSGLYLLQLQDQAGRRDWAGVRAGLDRLDSLRQQLGVRPEQLSLDAVFQEAWLRLASGDTAAATRALDDALVTLPFQRASLFEKTQGPVSVVFAMALRARLASISGDQVVATRWGRAARELWRGADPEVAGRLAGFGVPAGPQDRGSSSPSTRRPGNVPPNGFTVARAGGSGNGGTRAHGGPARRGSARDPVVRSPDLVAPPIPESGRRWEFRRSLGDHRRPDSSCRLGCRRR